MDPMMSAIRNRKSVGLMQEDHGDQKEGADLHGLLASLSTEEKMNLKTMLDKDQGSDGMSIAKGEPSKQEQMKIAQASAEENKRNMLEDTDTGSGGGLSEDQSDDIGKSMLDSRHMRGMATEKPRNLGDRVKQTIASKLKSKGKI